MSTMRRTTRGRAGVTALSLTIAAALALPACGSDGPATGADTQFAKSFCPKVMAWSDGSVFAVNAFQDASSAMSDPAQRKARYLQAFDDLQTNADEFEAALAKIDFGAAHGAEIERRMADAIGRIRAEYTADQAEADGLDATSYMKVSVNNGHLVTGNEKAKAIVFTTVGSLWEDFDVVDENCGRHPPVTMISPAAT
jgi:hypothetical protein